MKLSFSFSILFLFHKYITTITINDIRAISIIDDYIYLIHIYKNSMHTIAMPGIYLLYLFTIRKGAIHIKSDINIIFTINL